MHLAGSVDARDGLDGFGEGTHVVLGVAAVDVFRFVSDEAHPEVLRDAGVREIRDECVP